MNEVNNIKVGKKKDIFWVSDPNILFTEPAFFPTEEMCLEEKMNSVTRTVLCLTLVGYICSQNTMLLLICVILLFSIFFMYKWEKRTNEGYSDIARAVMPFTGAELYQESTPQNPFGNVLGTDYIDNPGRNPAMSCSTEQEMAIINENVKTAVSQINYTQPDIADKIFTDLGDKFEFEQSMRCFNATANTQIPNDQQAFAEFCFGSMISCKEGNKFACARNLPRYGEGS